MSNGNGHRWSKFWWGDWTNDKALHSCSLAARAFWLELLAIMHEGTPTGHLTINGRQVTLRQMAANANCTAKEATKALAELDEAGVFSRTTEGVIYCRRMVRDAAASEAGREHIEKRWQARDPNRDPNREATREPTRKPTREASRDPIFPPQTPPFLEAEAELRSREREPPLPPTAWGEATPASPGTPARSRSLGNNLRAVGTNPRETAENPRAKGSAKSREIPWRSGAIQMIYEQGMAARQAEDEDEDAKFQRECRESFFRIRALHHGTN